MSNNHSKIGKRIKKIRKQKKLSQDKLSKLADLSLNTIVNIEREKNTNPTVETLKKIANALNVTLDELVN